jgi:Holliday junction resolvasome RuvABC endonuclease subunit
MRRLVLGIDPGFASLGFAVVELGESTSAPYGAGLITHADMVVQIGVLRTKKSAKKQRVLSADDNIRRGRELALPIRGLFDCGSMMPVKGGQGISALFAANDKIRLVCAEKMSFPRSSSAAAKVAMAWGMIISNLELRGLPLVQATPQEVKARTVGKATASKEEVQAAMIRRFGKGLLRMLKTVPPSEHEHAFDALASVVACLDSEEGRMVRQLS